MAVVLGGVAEAKPRHPSAVGAIVAPVALIFTGGEAFGEKKERCRDTMRSFGAKFDPAARVHIVIHLQAFKNSLSVLDGGKVVFSEKLPIWAIPDLCQEALSEAQKVARRLSTPAPPAQSATP